MKKLATEIEQDLEQTLPQLRKTIKRKLSLAIAAMVEAPTPKPSHLDALQFIVLRHHRDRTHQQSLEKFRLASALPLLQISVL